MKRIILVAILAAVIAPMFIKGPDGEPIMSLSDWLPSRDIDMPSVSSGSSGSAPEYYRYQDASGNWQFTDQPPAGVAYELVEVDTNANVIQGTPLPSESPQSPSSEPAPGVAGYVENMQNVMQDAEDVQLLMDDRNSQLEAQLRASQ